VGNGWGAGPNQQVVVPPHGRERQLPYADATKTNQGFYVVGPNSTFLPGETPISRHPPRRSWRAISLLQACRPIADDPTATAGLSAPAFGKAMRAAELQPLLTVDYMESVPVNDNRAYNDLGPIMNAPATTSFNSVGRNQPYAAHTSQQWPEPRSVRRSVSRPTINSRTSPKTPSTATRAGGSRGAERTLNVGGGASQTLKNPFNWLTTSTASSSARGTAHRLRLPSARS